MYSFLTIGLEILCGDNFRKGRQWFDSYNNWQSFGLTRNTGQVRRVDLNGYFISYLTLQHAICLLLSDQLSESVYYIFTNYAVTNYVSIFRSRKVQISINWLHLLNYVILYAIVETFIWISINRSGRMLMVFWHVILRFVRRQNLFLIWRLRKRLSWHILVHRYVMLLAKSFSLQQIGFQSKNFYIFLLQTSCGSAGFASPVDEAG